MKKNETLAERLTKVLDGAKIFGSQVIAGIDNDSTSTMMTEIIDGKRTKCKDTRFKDGSFSFTK